MSSSNRGGAPDEKRESDKKENAASSDEISSEDIKTALLRSGYLLEHRVEIFLRKKGWYVEANSAYQDAETNKSRELDIYALRLHGADPITGDAIFVSVVAECINNPQPVAFITKEDKYAAFESNIKMVIDPQEVLDPASGKKMKVIDFLELAKVHHYCQGRIATQFCSFAKKGKDSKKHEWMASHDNNHFDSLMSLVKAVEYKNVAFEIVEGNDLRVEVMYPVLIVQGRLFDVRLSGQELEIIPVDHLKYRRSAIWGGVETGYTIDVVTERGLKDFETLISEEMDEVVTKIQLHADVLRRNIVNKPRNKEDHKRRRDLTAGKLKTR